jgi:hypothetical protein
MINRITIVHPRVAKVISVIDQYKPDPRLRYRYELIKNSMIIAKMPETKKRYRKILLTRRSIVSLLNRRRIKRIMNKTNDMIIAPSNKSEVISRILTKL